MYLVMLIVSEFFMSTYIIIHTHIHTSSLTKMPVLHTLDKNLGYAAGGGTS